MAASLTSYLEHLKALPFVKSVSVVKERVRLRNDTVDAVLSIGTPSGKSRIYCEIKASNLSNELAAQAVELGHRVHPLLVASPVIGSGIGEFLTANETNFVDLRGNCYLNLDGRYVARIQGRAGVTTVPSRSLRTPAYQVLFALLADPSLLAASVRTLAEAAGVSRQPAHSVRQRLVDLGYATRGAGGCIWMPGGAKRALDLWLASYAAAVRPSLLLGTYRTEDRDPDALEARVWSTLDEACAWRWGGGAAAQRLTGHYRGDTTIVHVLGAPAALPKKLRAVPDRDGNLVLLRPPGPTGMQGTTRATAHPLLVYSELLADGSERAREAAEDLAGRFPFGKAP